MGDDRPLRVPEVTLVDPAGMAAVTSVQRLDARARRSLRAAAFRWLTLDTEPTSHPSRESAALPLESARPGSAARGGQLGFYSYHDQRIYLLDTPQKDVGHTAYFTLVHEMVHAIQDGDGGLSASSQEPRSFDAELGEEAALEGEARYYAQLVRAQLRGHWTDDLRTGFAAEPPAADEMALREPSITRASARRFMDSYGPYFAAHDGEFRARFLAGDATLISEAGTALLLQAWHGWRREHYGDASPCSRRGANYRAVHEDRVGPWVVQTLFSRAAQSTTAGAEVAKQTRGDWLGSYVTRSSDSFVIWRIDMQDEAAVKRAAKIFEARRHPAHAALRVIETSHVLTLVGGTALARAESVLRTCK